MSLKMRLRGHSQKADPKIAAYWAPQINYLGDVPLNHGGWSSPHIRLYNKNYGQWSEADYDVIHPGFKVSPGYHGGNLKSKTIHYSFSNVENFIAKINRYSTLEAIKWHLDGRRMSLGKAIWRTVDRFFRRFIGKKGYKDGLLWFCGGCFKQFP